MSDRWPGGIISGTPPVPTGGGAQDSASGIWTIEQADQYIATNEWPGTGIPDPQFQYVTALLHGDGANGGQNNTFIDSSSNNFPVFKNGNTTQGSFSPYGNLWSNFFNGSSDYLSSASNSAFVLDGSFTIECWFYLTRTPTPNSDGTPLGAIASYGGTAVAGRGYTLNVNTATNQISFALIGSGNGIGAVVGLTLNTWHHVAVTFNGSTGALYFNGVSQTLTTNNWSWTAPTSPTFKVGAELVFLPGYPTYFPGYISNLRIVKGSVLYTSSFTPSTTPLTAVTNTSILTCQSNRFIDNSSSPKTITVNSTPSVQRFSPFQNLATYTPARVGGSAYFDGSGDNLSISDSSAWNVGSGDFTAEAWIYPQSFANEPMIMGQWSGDLGGTGLNWALMLSSGSTGYLRLITSSNGSGVLFDLSTSTFALTLNAWQHIAAVRNGNTYTIYVNGVSRATTTNSSALYDANNAFTIGAETNSPTQYFNGYISDARFVKSAVYTTGFTPPTTPLTAITNTQLLCNFTNAAIFDSDASNDFETVGNAQISTSVVKYGTGSLSFDGTTDYVVQPTSTNYGYGTGNFTIEFWLYLNSTATQTIVSNLTAANSVNPHLYYLNNTNIRYYTNNADQIIGPALSSGVWYHIAVCRAGGSTRLFVNGTQFGVTYADNNNYGTAAPLGIGTYWASGAPFTTLTLNGYIDDFRITNGYARYWYNFQPPTRAFPNYGGTVIEMEDPLFEYNTLLLNGDGANGGQNNTFLDSSTNNFTITRNGNTTQGSFSPYGDLWSMFLNGQSNNYLTYTGTAFGSGNFTWEAWVNPSEARANAPWTDAAGGLLIRQNTNGVLIFDRTTSQIASNTTGLAVGQWSHVAVVRNSGVITVYINGQPVVTASWSSNFSGTSYRIGAFIDDTTSPNCYFGYLSNYRLVVGSALYTSAFTPPTTPLTAVSGTALLTFQSNRFLDNSTNNRTFGIVGSPSVQRFSPFEPSAPYSTSVIGGSAYFDGSGDYLTLPSSASLATGSSDFTIECWVYFNNTNNQYVFSGSGATIQISGGSLVTYDGSTNRTIGTPVANQWLHIAICRSGTTIRAFLNGVQGSSFTSSGTQYTHSAGVIAAELGTGNGPLNGYISNYRFVVGTAVYTAAFTPPTSPVTAITNTQLLCNFTNAAIPDLAMQNNLETIGGAQITNSVVKYGSGSMMFDGVGDQLLGTLNPALAFGTGDFTIEAWVYQTQRNTGSDIVSCHNYGVAADWLWRIDSSGNLYFQISSSTSGAQTSSAAVPLNTWTHVAVTRSSGTVRQFINGAQVSSASYTTSVGNTIRLSVGAATNLNAASTFYGYIDDLRITRGIARYVQPFTPPTAALPTY